MEEFESYLQVFVAINFGLMLLKNLREEISRILLSYHNQVVEHIKIMQLGIVEIKSSLFNYYRKTGEVVPYLNVNTNFTQQLAKLDENINSEDNILGNEFETKYNFAIAAFFGLFHLIVIALEEKYEIKFIEHSALSYLIFFLLYSLNIIYSCTNPNFSFDMIGGYVGAIFYSLLFVIIIPLIFLGYHKILDFINCSNSSWNDWIITMVLILTPILTFLIKSGFIFFKLYVGENSKFYDYEYKNCLKTYGEIKRQYSIIPKAYTLEKG